MFDITSTSGSFMEQVCMSTSVFGSNFTAGVNSLRQRPPIRTCVAPNVTENMEVYGIMMIAVCVWVYVRSLFVRIPLA